MKDAETTKSRPTPEERVEIMAHYNKMIAEGVDTRQILISFRDVAAFRGSKESTVRSDHHLGKLNLPVQKFGRSCRVRLSDVLAAIGAVAD